HRRYAAGTEPFRDVGALALPVQKAEASTGTDDHRRAIGLRALGQERGYRGANDVADDFHSQPRTAVLDLLLRPLFRTRRILGPDGNDPWLAGLVFFGLLLLGRHRGKANCQERGPRERPGRQTHILLLL